MLFGHCWVQGKPSSCPVFTGKHHHCWLHGSRCNLLPLQQGDEQGSSRGEVRGAGRRRTSRGADQNPGAEENAMRIFPFQALYMSDWGLMEGWLERNSFLAADGHSQITDLKPGVICVPRALCLFHRSSSCSGVGGGEQYIMECYL